MPGFPALAEKAQPETIDLIPVQVNDQVCFPGYGDGRRQHAGV
jgi:hypothetical protein